jgi:sugar lactone lactonase YvrE
MSCIVHANAHCKVLGMCYSPASDHIFASVCYTRSTSVFVSGTHLSAVRKYSAQGQLAFEISACHGARDRLNVPRGLALSVKQNQLYVADSGNSRVAVFDASTGKFCSFIGATHSQRDRFFEQPCDIAL